MAIIKRFQGLGKYVSYRPDYIFSEAIEPYDLGKKPVKGQTFLHQGSRTMTMSLDEEWYKRTRQKLNYAVSIRSNLRSAFHRQPDDVKIVLFGKCSLTEPFLTNEELNAMCIVRHPLYAFDSFFGSRHPQWVWHKDGIEAPEFIEWYFKQWWKVVDDYATSGNPIV
ncbi:MAG: hypothetical protein KAJ55_02035, partial [Anaerolineales bacterium]|nr:hypothetical protein [Anaerolineales bacterium]